MPEITFSNHAGGTKRKNLHHHPHHRQQLLLCLRVSQQRAKLISNPLLAQPRLLAAILIKHANKLRGINLPAKLTFAVTVGISRAINALLLASL